MQAVQILGGRWISRVPLFRVPAARWQARESHKLAIRLQRMVNASMVLPSGAAERCATWNQFRLAKWPNPNKKEAPTTEKKAN